MPDKNVQLPDGRVVSFPDSMADADIAAVIKKQMAPAADPTAVETSGPFAGIPVAAKPSEAMPGRFGMHDQPNPESTLSTLPGVGGAVGGALGGMPGAGLGGAAGESAAELIRMAATGKPAESPVTDIATQGTLQGLLEGSGKAISWAGGKLAPVASQALARILRLNPKAYQFGREPAEEVLREGIKGGSLKTLVENIGQASKETTSKLNDMLKAAPGTVNIENASLDVANSLPGEAGNRFLKIVDDAATKLGYRSNQLSSLSNAESNALKQEVARQARFVEGDLRPSMANAVKVFGGKIKDGIIKNVPDAEGLLQSSANLTEASKAGDYAVRAEKAGQSRSGLSAVDIKKPSTYLHPITDTVTGAKTLFRFADALKDSGVPISLALRTAFNIVYPGSSNEDSASGATH